MGWFTIIEIKIPLYINKYRLVKACYLSTLTVPKTRKSLETNSTTKTTSRVIYYHKSGKLLGTGGFAKAYEAIDQ